MRNKPTLGPVQLCLMAVGSALVFPYTFMPILSAPPRNQDAWIVLFMAMAYIFIINIPLLVLINKFRGFNVNEMSELILGKFFGKLADIVLVLFFIFCFTGCSLITAVFINLYLFPDTPTWAILLYMILPAAYASYKGAGSIGRLATFIVPFIIFTVIIFFVLGFELMDFDVLKPILADSTFLELNAGAFFTGARYSEILIFLVFSFWLEEKSSINKVYTASLLLFTFCFFLMLLPTLTVLGVELGKHAWDPYFIFTGQVVTYDFISRVQSINTLAWFPTALLKLTMYNFMASYVLSGVAKSKSYKRFVIPIALIGFVICVLPIMDKSSTVEFLRSDMVFPFAVLPATFVVPLIMIIVYFIRRKKIQETLDSIEQEKEE